MPRKKSTKKSTLSGSTRKITIEELIKRASQASRRFILIAEIKGGRLTVTCDRRDFPAADVAGALRMASADLGAAIQREADEVKNAVVIPKRKKAAKKITKQVPRKRAKTC